MTNEIKLSSVVLDVTMPVDMLQDYVANAVSEALAQRDADHLAELRAYELTVANLREQLVHQARADIFETELIRAIESHHGIKEQA